MFGFGLIKKVAWNVGSSVIDGLETAVKTYQQIRDERANKMNSVQTAPSAQGVDSDAEESEKRRERLRQNMLNKEDQDHFDELERARQTSMLHSQGQSDHSGSSYHGPGKPMSGKTNSNMWQRNFDNHQGN
jgi:hypothetical protein